MSHTPEGHPDLEPLKQASEEIHQLASRINTLQRAPLRGEARRQALRDLEAAVDGLEGLVTPDRSAAGGRDSLYPRGGSGTAYLSAATIARLTGQSIWHGRSSGTA